VTVPVASSGVPPDGSIGEASDRASERLIWASIG
jgi:hypothetical protein